MTIKELGFFDIIFAQTLTIHNICLTHFTPSILIYANALGYILSINLLCNLLCETLFKSINAAV